jgi:hypothetical protein
MAKDLNLSWVLPTTRESNRPLRVEEIAAVEISLSADGGANFAAYDTYTPDVLSAVIPELEIGEWTVRGVVVDTKGKKSKPLDRAVVIEDESAPGALVELTLTF